MTLRQELKCVVDPGIAELAESLKVLSDANRLRIMCLLLGGERCVCEVEKELSISQQLASHHLNVLKEAGLLRSRKEGTSSYYSVVEEKLERTMAVMNRYLGRHKAGRGACGSACCAPLWPKESGAVAGSREVTAEPVGACGVAGTRRRRGG